MNSSLDLEDILNDKAVEEDFLEVPLNERVFKTFFVLFLIIAGLVVFQLVKLGLFNHSFYKTRALANARYSLVQPAPRGVITDRFGKAIVENEPTMNVVLVPHDLPKAIDEKNAVFKEMTGILSLNEDEIAEKLKEKDWRFSEKLFLKSNPTHVEMAAIEAKKIPGFRIESAFKRIYESPFASAQVAGFVGLVEENDLRANPELFIDDEIGRAGLEAYYDSYLRGVNGEDVYLKDALGVIRDQSFSISSQPGNKLETFIDAEFQNYFYNRLKTGLIDLGREVGLGIALNPENGEVLALVGIPGLDPTRVAEYLNDKNQPFLNRAIGGLYTPGSTIKPLMATAALAEGVVTPATRIYSQGFIEIPNPYDPENPSRFLDWKPHGWVDVYSALARSSNVYFYEVGGGFPGQIGLGIERLVKWWQKFSLDQKTNIDLPGEKSGFLPNPEWKEKRLKEPWRIGDTYNVSIGQGDLIITPIELLNYISAIANGGVFYEPRVMKIIVDGNGEEIKKSSAVVLKDLSKELGFYIKEVQKGMRDAVAKSYGTAYLLNDLPMTAAAKTGTSQIANNEKVNAFFVGYAPYENPQIAILVLVENAREGSLNAVPIAKDAFLWYYENRFK